MLARAKINLGLWITGQRSDGFHNIITLFHLIELADEIHIEPGQRLEVRCDACPEGPDNLAWKAAQLLGLRASITIRKRIPMGAGLGGGSSDAACVLKALGAGLPQQELFQIARQLGSDVGFFLSGFRAGVGRGRGDELVPVESRLGAEVALFVPEQGISTGWAYQLVARQKAYSPGSSAGARVSGLVQAVEAGDLTRLAQHAFNDFERVILPRRPELAKAKQVLLEAGAALALLSGSGGVVFGLFPRGTRPKLRNIESGIWMFSRLT